MSRVRRAGAAGAAVLAALLAASGCARAPRFVPVQAEAAAAGRDRLSESCRKAWAERRLKALYAVEVTPVIGAVQRGYLSLFWDGRRLLWRTSLAMAGQVDEGVLERGVNGPGGLASALSSRLNDTDALAVLLGAPECPVSAPAVEWDGASYRFRLDQEGRTAVMEPSGRITGMAFPAGVGVRLAPGEDVPGRIEVESRKGRAVLKLQAAGGWPAGEPAPPGGD